MQQLLTSFTRYEYWANQQLLQVIVQLPVAQQEQEIVSSFPSIRKTCLHIWDASAIWWQRLQMIEPVVIPGKQPPASMREIAAGILRQNEQWIEWIVSVTAAELEAVLAYRNMKGEAFEQQVKEILLHLNNHGTYHRGQLVTMLRQLGITQLPQTDYILYSRS